VARTLTAEVVSELETSAGRVDRATERTDVFVRGTLPGVEVVARWRSPTGREWALAALHRRAAGDRIQREYRVLREALLALAAAPRLREGAASEGVERWLRGRSLRADARRKAELLAALGIPPRSALPSLAPAPMLAWHGGLPPRLVSPEGPGAPRPVAGAPVLLVSASGDPVLRSRTDADGRVRLPPVHPAGELRIDGPRWRAEAEAPNATLPPGWPRLWLDAAPPVSAQPSRPHDIAFDVELDPTRCTAVRAAYHWCRASARVRRPGGDGGVPAEHQLDARAPGADRERARRAAEAALQARIRRELGRPSDAP